VPISAEGWGIHDMEEFASFYGKLSSQELGAYLFFYSICQGQATCCKAYKATNKKPGEIVYPEVLISKLIHISLSETAF